MEGVPRIPMTSFPMRRSADTPNFKSRLKSFISNHYNEEPDSYANEIHELESLRASAVHVSKDYSGCSTLKKYFCQLNFLKSRFPMNDGGSCAISFSWYDVFSDTVHGWSDVDFEMSCVLYNIGALHSELGALDNRHTADGMKTSCTHFQCAAWAFNHLRHNYQKFFTPDVSPDMLNILNNTCLAQAQECILEKSLIDNRKSTITAKVALQIVEYYSTALRIIDGMLKDAAQYSDKLIKSVKKWRKLVELKVHYYGCIAYLYRGMQAEDQGKWGERVTMYKAAVDKLAECQKLAKHLEKTDPVHDTLHFTQDVVGGKVAIAEKENEFIYHEKVPELEAVMSDVKAVSLVKGIPFKFDDPQVAGPDIFGRLVPMEAHEASSLYSEEKAKILRTYSKKIEEKNESLDRFIIPLQLDHLELQDSEKIPQELLDCCAALSVNKDAVKRLSELMANLSSLYHDVEANLEEIQDHLADQEKREKDYQEVVGKRPPNNIIYELSKELDKYQGAQTAAAESNQTLHDAMVLHVSNLQILMKPLDEVMKHIPKFDELERNEEAFERMKKLAGKVGEMRKQREMLESQLRDSILNDDITKSLVVKKDEDLETVFREELEKHDRITQLLDQNLLAQENIVRALTEANAEYAESRRATVELKKKRDSVIQGFLSSYDAYDELVSKCNKGIEFYTKLNANVEKLVQRMRSVCKVQNEEREINMERIIRKAQNPTPLPSTTLPTSVGYTSPMTPGGYPTNSISPILHNSSLSRVPTSSNTTPTTGGGTHLKLKDYLAMKKEGLSTNEMMSIANSVSNPTSLPYDASGGPVPVQYLVHQPGSSSTPVPPMNPSLWARPAPVGSEDVNKKDYMDSHQTYPGQQQHSYIHPQQPPSSYGYHNPPSSIGAPTTQFPSQHQTNTTGVATTFIPPQQPTQSGAMPSYNPPSQYNQQQPPVKDVTTSLNTPPQHHNNTMGAPTAMTHIHQQHQPHVMGVTASQFPSYQHHPTMGGTTNNHSQLPSSMPASSHAHPPHLPPSSAAAMQNHQNQQAHPTMPVTNFPPQPQQQTAPNSNMPTASYAPQQQQPSTNYVPPPNMPTTSYTQQPPPGVEVTTTHAAPQSQPTTSEQQPYNSFDYYSQNSFLAQYIRQNQGYVSSKAPPTTSTVPGSNDTAAYNNYFPQQMSYPQQGYSAPQYQPTNQFAAPATSATAAPQPQPGINQSYPQQPQYPQQQGVSGSGYPPQQPQQQYQYGQVPQYPSEPQQQQMGSGYFSGPPQAPSQPHQQQQQPMSSTAKTNSNLDLLSDLDFNVLPTVQPLVPKIAGNSGPPENSHT